MLRWPTGLLIMITAVILQIPEQRVPDSEWVNEKTVSQYSVTTCLCEKCAIVLMSKSVASVFKATSLFRHL
jgi:hypothetical protein